MRKRSLLAAVLLSATVLYAGSNSQPLQVKTGLWQVTENLNYSGLPPEMQRMMGQGRPITYKSCVRAKDLNSNPFESGSDEHCKWTVLNSSATDMDVKGTGCRLGANEGMDANVNLKIHIVDPGTVTATADGTAVGNGMNVSMHNAYTGKWISATCPAGM